LPLIRFSYALIAPPLRHCRRSVTDAYADAIIFIDFLLPCHSAIALLMLPYALPLYSYAIS